MRGQRVFGRLWQRQLPAGQRKLQLNRIVEHHRGRRVGLLEAGGERRLQKRHVVVRADHHAVLTGAEERLGARNLLLRDLLHRVAALRWDLDGPGRVLRLGHVDLRGHGQLGFGGLGLGSSTVCQRGIGSGILGRLVSDRLGVGRRFRLGLGGGLRLRRAHHLARHEQVADDGEMRRRLGALPREGALAEADDAARQRQAASQLAQPVEQARAHIRDALFDLERADLGRIAFERGGLGREVVGVAGAGEGEHAVGDLGGDVGSHLDGHGGAARRVGDEDPTVHLAQHQAERH